MFIRSENLFIRPAWPEDRARLSRLDVPVRHDPLIDAGQCRGLVVTMPGTSGIRPIGTACLSREGQGWKSRLWLAPAWRHLGLFDEAEDMLEQLVTNLSPPRGGARADLREPLAA